MARKCTTETVRRSPDVRTTRWETSQGPAAQRLASSEAGKGKPILQLTMPEGFLRASMLVSEKAPRVGCGALVAGVNASEGQKPMGVSARRPSKGGWFGNGSLAGARLRSRGSGRSASLRWGLATGQQRQGSRDSERGTARQGGKTPKGEPQERSRREIEPGRPGEEEAVRRVRNPGGGTDWGLASPGISLLPWLTCAEEDETPGEPAGAGVVLVAPRPRWRQLGRALEGSRSPREVCSSVFCGCSKPGQKTSRPLNGAGVARKPIAG